MSTPEIAEELGLAKTTILYWLLRIASPLGEDILKVAGTKAITFSSRGLDLLPFVEKSHLRWCDEKSIILRLDNSKRAVISRAVNAKNFFRLAGFYLAEGTKTRQHAGVSNTNLNLVKDYHNTVQSFVHSEVIVRDVSKEGRRLRQQEVKIGGLCLKALLTNAIEAILNFLGDPSNPSEESVILGLAFLNGCADGDGGVSKARQPKSAKERFTLYLTEGRLTHAARLLQVLRRIFGTGWLYKPLGRNYYVVASSLSPKRAMLLLSAGFFSAHHESRRRLALKALDSAYISRYVRLFSLFGARTFSRIELDNAAADTPPDFIGRSVMKGFLRPVGVALTKGRRSHWCRLYRLSDDMQITSEKILNAIDGSSGFDAARQVQGSQ